MTIESRPAGYPAGNTNPADKNTPVGNANSAGNARLARGARSAAGDHVDRSEEHTSELQSLV